MIDFPHHDGSELYKQGNTVWLRVPVGFAADRVHVRTVVDGEPRFTEAAVDHRDSEATWWKATLHTPNRVTPYRFYLGRRWLTAAGLVDRDVSDATDFKHVTYDEPPAWTRDAIIYQIFPDRFARSGGMPALPDWAIPCEWDTTPVIGRGPGVSEQIYGGDLDGVIAHLDHIQSLGADTVYLTPFFPSRSNHRYDAATFDAVDPLLGGDLALKRLADAVHERGMRLIGDITTNHVGASHEWFRSGRWDLFYFDEKGDYESWLGVRSLPKLNWGSPEVRSRMIEVMRRWLGPLDGWRVDVANMTGRRGHDDYTHEVARELREAMPGEVMLVAEHAHDATGDLDRGGWQGTMNYGGFTRPVWNWLVSPDTAADYLGVPGGVPRRGGRAVVETMRDFGSRMSWSSLVHSWQLLDSHDSARIRTVVGSLRSQLTAVGLQAALPGVPMIFAGSEFGLRGENGEGSRTPMPWSRPADREGAALAGYQEIMGLRRREAALRRGGLRWLHVADDALVFARETREESLVVRAWRDGQAPEVAGVPSGATVYATEGFSVERISARTSPHPR